MKDKPYSWEVTNVRNIKRVLSFLQEEHRARQAKYKIEETAASIATSTGTSEAATSVTTSSSVATGTTSTALTFAQQVEVRVIYFISSIFSRLLHWFSDMQKWLWKTILNEPFKKE